MLSSSLVGLPPLPVGAAVLPVAGRASAPVVRPIRAADDADDEEDDDLVDDEPLAPDQPLADEDSAFEDFDDEFDDDFEEDEHDPDWDHPDEGDAPPPPPPTKGPGKKK